MIDSPASARIKAFLSAQAWDAQALDAFLNDWNSYRPEERAAALSSPGARLLSQAIQRQILEERALLGLGENEAARKRLQSIMQFTQEIGLQDPAITDSPNSAADPSESAVDAAASPPAQSVGVTVEELAPGQANTPCTAGHTRPGPAYCRDSLVGNHPGPTLVVISAGKFTMGGSQPDEQPIREVTIAYPFALSTHEITVGDFELFCRETQRVCPPQPWSGTDYPVVNVTWHDAVAYTQWLSAKTGQRYRLPSEAEWEYAARAGTTTAYPFGDTASPADAVFSPGQPLSAPLPKTDRSIQVNAFHLHHMPGNVREWVADAWRAGYPGASADGVAYTTGSQDTAEFKVVRGGAYIDGPGALRSGARYKLPADTADAYTGFRVVRDINW
jgi:formylglycine-generating enzyme required for sulfatase activity